MTTLAITPNWKSKTAKFKGTIAAGEHIYVTIQNDNGEGEPFIGDASTLRLRVVDPANGRTLAIFPVPDSPDGQAESGDSDSSDGQAVLAQSWDDDLSPLRCTLNLNTVQMLRAVPPAANVPLLFVLDDYENKTLYFKEQFHVEHWPRLRGEEEPTDLDNYKNLIAEFNARLDGFGSRITDAENAAQAATENASAAATEAGDAKTIANGAVGVAQQAKEAAETSQASAAASAAAAAEAQEKAEEAAESINNPDATLTEAGVAADAKATGERIAAEKTRAEAAEAAEKTRAEKVEADLMAELRSAQKAIDDEAELRAAADSDLEANKADKTEVSAIRNSVSNLTAEVASAQTAIANRYTKSEVDAKIAAVQTFQKYLVQTLPDPEAADYKGLYLVPTGETSSEGDLCEEWTVVGEVGSRRWEKIGGTAVDLSNYYTKSETDAALASKVPSSRTINGKALTDNVSLSGADIAVSGSDQAKIDAVLAAKLGNTGAQTLTGSLEVSGKNSSVIVHPDKIQVVNPKIPPRSYNLRFPGAGVGNGVFDTTQNIASDFDEGTTYHKGDLVMYEGLLFRCIVASHIGAWNDLNFEDVDVGTVLAGKVPASRTVNGKALSSDVTLTGADIPVDATQGAQTINVALAGKLDKSGDTMTGDLMFDSYQHGIKFYDNIAPSKIRSRWDNPADGMIFDFLGGTDGAHLVRLFCSRPGRIALAAPNPTAGNLAALDANGNPTDSGIAAGDLLTIVTLSDSTETMAAILARLNAINAARQHVFFDCSGIDVNPRLYLCTIMIDADANAVRVYDQVTGKLYIGPYDATETIGEVFAKAVDAYHSITVSAVTLDGVTVTGQTVTIREGTDATAPVYATATITDGAPAVFVVPKGMIYFLEITDALADHFGPRVTSGAKQGIATSDAAVTFTYYDAEHIDVSEITTFAKLQEALTWFGTNEAAARNNLVGLEIADTWTATNGIVYDNPRVVWDVHYFEDENGISHLGALMGTKYCSHNDVQFDAAEGEECDSSTETVAEADVYYYGLALGQTSKTAANLTLLELSEGDALPYADYAKIYKSAIRDTTRNSLQYGYNNWRDSAYRQYLNSDAKAGQWWGATHIGDIAPSQLNSVRGFMAGCSAALLAAAKKVKVATWPNSITDGPSQITTLYKTLDTFFLPSGSEVYGDVNRSGGASVEGELSPYWQARTGYTAPDNAATSTRIIYRELPVGSMENRSAAAVRLRSVNRGTSTSVCNVTTSGQVYNYGAASTAFAVVPACAIY